MKVLTISDVRKNIAAVIDSVIDDQEECVIPRGGGKAVVIISLDEWNSIKETLHLLGDRANARHLFNSLDEAERGDVVHHKASELDDASEQRSAA